MLGPPCIAEIHIAAPPLLEGEVEVKLLVQHADAQHRLSFQLSQPLKRIPQGLSDFVAHNNMASSRRARPPKQSALAASQNSEGSGGVVLSVKVCNPAGADEPLPVFMPLVKQPLAMQAVASPSPTRLRSGNILGKVMDTVEVCIDCLSQQCDNCQVPD